VIAMLSCPVPLSQYPEVTLAHGAGGRLMNELITHMFRQTFNMPEPAHDAAVLPHELGRLALTTDSYVVSPLEFPGGSIGSLAVYGTVNDLAMAGARARYLTLGVIAEEGLPMLCLWREVQAIAAAATAVGVRIVTGDIKVVERGKGDQLYLNTAGVGFVTHDVQISPSEIRDGDLVLLSGDLGRHGAAVMAAREGIEVEDALRSDCAPLVEPVMHLLDHGVRVHCLRDLTRGGLASALNELASSAAARIEIDESATEVIPSVHAVCELLGLDPLYVANEGRFVAVVHPDDGDRALGLLQTHAVSAHARRIGQVRAGRGEVRVRTALGTTRMLDMLAGALLPRIC
jgi:hydrogenase expression/formation protein HypE